MADKKFSELDPVGSLTGTEMLPVIKEGLPKRTTVADVVANYVLKSGDTMNGSLTATTLTAGTATDVLGTALSVIRNNVAVGRIDNNASGLRVQAQNGSLQLRGTGNTGIAIDASGNAVVAGTITGANLSGTNTGDQPLGSRTITGTTNQITVTNGDGVSGNPTLSLPQAVTGKGTKRVTVLDDFQTDNWTHSSGTGTKALDATDLVAGEKSLLLTTAGSGSTINDYLSKGFNFTLNTSYRQCYFEIDIKVDDIANVSRLYMYLYSSVAGNTYRYAIIEATGTKYIPNGEWFTLRVPAHSFNKYSSGASDSSVGWAFEQIRFRLSDTGTAVAFRFNGLRIVENDKKAIVMVTFDDSNKSVASVALPIMAKYGIRGTSFNIKENVNTTASYMTTADLQKLERLGWTNALHGQSPTSTGWANLDEQQLNRYLYDSRAFFAALGLRSGLDCCSYPNGNYGASRSSYIYNTVGKYCRVARTIINSTSDTYDSPDPLLIRVGDDFYCDAGNTAATVVANLSRVASYGGLAVLTFHDIVSTAPTGNDYLDADFDTIMSEVASLASNGLIDVMTFAEYRDYITGKSQLDTGETNIQRYVAPYHGGTTPAVTSQTPTVGRVMLHLVEVERRCKVDAIVIANAATVAGEVTVGLYGPVAFATDTCEGASMLVQSASTTVSGTSTSQVVTFAETTVGPGKYYVAVEFSDAVNTYMRHSNGMQCLGWVQHYARSGGYGALPTTCPAVIDTGSAAVGCRLRVSGVA